MLKKKIVFIIDFISQQIDILYGSIITLTAQMLKAFNVMSKCFEMKMKFLVLDEVGYSHILISQTSLPGYPHYLEIKNFPCIFIETLLYFPQLSRILFSKPSIC